MERARFYRNAFGTRLRTLRREMDLSMREVATGLGVTITYVSHLEAGRTRPSHDMALRVARLFDADEEEVAVLAGYLPGDIEEILVENPKRALATLRASGGGNAG